MKLELRCWNWERLYTGTGEDAVSYFLEILNNLCSLYIPRTRLILTKSTHLWLNDDCKEAIKHKNRCEGTPDYEFAQRRCQDIIN